MTPFSPSRRAALTLLASTAILPLIPRIADAATPAITAIILSDLHSAYDHTGQMLAEVERQVAAAPGPALILVNGDLFEAGNAVTMASGGEIDWAFLAALAETAPTVFNIGNHEPDVDNDLAHFVARAQALGVTVLTNITDSRTGAPYAPASATLDLDGQAVTLVGIAVDAINTYPKATREQLSIPAPADWAAENLAGLLGAGQNIVLSHAGVVPDKAILPLLPDATLMVGGHDHLELVHEAGATRYLHTGCWTTALTVARLLPGAAPEIERVTIDPTAAASARLAALIPAVLEKYLTDEDKAVVAEVKAPMSADETGLFVAAAMAAKAGADVGFIGHTTFGAGLNRGPLSRYAFNSSVRFEGKLMQTEVSAEVLGEILARCNQFGDFPFAARTGDYLYAAPAASGKARYRLVCNDWSAINQKSYFGREDLEFTEIADAKVKAVTLAAL